MYQLPTCSLNIIDSVLFVRYMESTIGIFPIQLLDDGLNFFSARFHLKILFHFYIHLHEMTFCDLKIVF